MLPLNPPANPAPNNPNPVVANPLSHIYIGTFTMGCGACYLGISALVSETILSTIGTLSVSIGLTVVVANLSNFCIFSFNPHLYENEDIRHKISILSLFIGTGIIYQGITYLQNDWSGPIAFSTVGLLTVSSLLSGITTYTIPSNLIRDYFNRLVMFTMTFGTNFIYLKLANAIFTKQLPPSVYYALSNLGTDNEDLWMNPSDVETSDDTHYTIGGNTLTQNTVATFATISAAFMLFQKIQALREAQRTRQNQNPQASFASFTNLGELLKTLSTWLTTLIGTIYIYTEISTRSLRQENPSGFSLDFSIISFSLSLFCALALDVTNPLLPERSIIIGVGTGLFYLGISTFLGGWQGPPRWLTTLLSLTPLGLPIFVKIARQLENKLYPRVISHPTLAKSLSYIGVTVGTALSYPIILSQIPIDWHIPVVPVTIELAITSICLGVLLCTILH